MVSVILDAHGDERGLLVVLAALVPAAADGVVRDVLVVAEPGNRTAELVADETGALLVTEGSVTERVRLAVARAKSDWLLLLTPVAVPEPGFERHIAWFVARCSTAGETRRAAAFAASRAERGPLREAGSAILRLLTGRRPRANAALLLHRRLYEEIAGADAASAASPARVAARVGTRRIDVLRAEALPVPQDIDVSAHLLAVGR